MNSKFLFGLLVFAGILFSSSPANAEESITMENEILSDSGIKITTFGMFDAEDDGNLVHSLFVGEEYWFYTEYQNTLDSEHDLRIFVQLLDKNKDNVIKKIDGHGIQMPSEIIGNGFSWTPEYAGDFKIIYEIASLDDPSVRITVPEYDLIVSDRPSLKQQLQKATPIDDIICKNTNHLLVERANGKLSCVHLHTAEKLDWKSVDPDVIVFSQSVKELLLMQYEDVPEVKAFYAKYTNAQSSVRYDHVSYFAENSDESLIRMNLFFDENYDIDSMELHCYYQKTHQYEVDQEHIVSSLENHSCQKPVS